MAQPKKQTKTAPAKAAAKPKSADRRAPYLLEGESPEPELLSLFHLLGTIQDTEARIELSGLVRARLRSLYPAGSGKIGTANLKNGLRFDVDLGDLFGAEFFVGNMNETDVLNALTATLPADANTVDVGANFGLFGVHAGHVAETGKVIALEPLPSACKLLETNVQQNGLSDRVEVINAAVSQRGGKAKFFVATDGAFSGLRDTGRSPVLDTVNVSKVALDKCEPVNALDRIDFLKIDTEGHENQVLAGAHKTLARATEALVMLEYSHKNLTADTRESFLGELQPLMEAGFEAQLFDGNQKLVKLKKAGDIPAETSGTVFLAGKDCAWAADFFSALANEVDATKHAASDGSTVVILHEFTKLRNQLADVDRLQSAFPSTDGDASISKRVLREVNRLRTESERAETQFRTELERAEAYRNGLQGHYDKADADRKRLRQKSDQLAEAVEKYKARLEAFQTATDALHEKMNARDEEHLKKIADIKSSLDHQYERAEELKKTLVESMTTRKELEGKLTEANELLKASKQEISSTKRLLTHAEARVTDLEGKLKTAATARDSLNERMEAFRNLSSDLQQKLEAAKAAQETARRDFDLLLSKEKTAHEQTRTRLEADLSKEKAAHEKTHQDLKQILSEERNAHKQTKADLTREKTAHEKTHRDLKFIISEERNALKREKAAHEKTHRDLKMLLSQERAAHSETRQHLDVSRELRADQRRELDEAATRQAALEAEVAALTEEKRALQTEIDEKRALVRVIQQREALHEIGLGKHLRRRDRS
ncbi:FkbM family methyltransferase [Henriciella algicola]|nr:FkbM family methyltransferase [Henriciella algicola]